MKAAYSYQIINFIVALITMYLLLSFLSVNEYVLWSIFVTFIGVTVQLENAVQMVSVRELARGYHQSFSSDFMGAFRKAKKAYLLLTLFVVTGVALAGFVYISLIAKISTLDEYFVEWILLLFAYSINYFFGTNNSILLATNNVSSFNNTLSFTRILNVIFVFILLKLGYSILGLALSLAISVIIGCAIIGVKAARVRAQVESRPAGQNVEDKGSPSFKGKGNNFVLYTLYTLCAYVLYKGGILLVAGHFEKATVAAYALSLQIFTLLTTFALVPIQIWLSHLVAAVNENDAEQSLRELSRTFLAVNGLFICGSVGLIALGQFMLSFIKTDIQLPGAWTLLAMAVAFLVEINILLCINLLVTCRNYRFLKVYAKTSLISLMLAVLLVTYTDNIILSLLLVPALIQSVLCLPAIFRYFCDQLSMAPTDVIRGMFVNFKNFALT